jgi:DNA modification methylase
MSDQASFNLSTTKTGPVECLGQSFPSEEARREHFLKLLAAKLKEPAFRQIEGFPIGTDEAILALSDPPYYTACPNPWLGEFIKHYGTPYDPKKPYHREPFAADVSEGKNHPIYNAHSYHTKVPHRAIMKYILHYTQPGDVVFDGFCGTGMTGVAAQLCGDRTEVQALGYRVLDDGTILNEEGKAFSKVGIRRAILNDLSPSATFIAYNQNTPTDLEDLDIELKSAVADTESKLSDLAKTGSEDIYHVVWSEVLLCEDCGNEFSFWDAGVDKDTKSVKGSVACTKCGTEGGKRSFKRAQTQIFNPETGLIGKVAKYIPVAIETLSNRTERPLTAKEFATTVALNDIPIRDWYPSASIERDIDLWYERDYRSLGLLSVDAFYTRRNLAIMASLWSRIFEIKNARTRNAVRFIFSAMIVNLSRMNRWRPDVSFPYNPLSGTLYIPSLSVESSPFIGWRNKGKRIIKIWAETKLTTPAVINTQSTTSLQAIPSNSLDYIFIDPPFGSNIIYSDLSLLHEGWLALETNTKQEAVVHRRKKEGAQTLDSYRGMIAKSLCECFRCLKPGRWITIEFSNTQASVWNAIQSALQEAGFVVANVAGLDKQAGSFKAVTTPTAVKQDLVISAYKPNGGLEDRFAKTGNTEAGVWDFIGTHLKNLPIFKIKGGQIEHMVERDPRILYDRMVAFYVGHSTPVPLSSGEFQAELQEQFPVRDGMIFLPAQVNLYDQKRVQMESIGQLSIFVEDERSAIDWVRQFLKERPSTQADIQPDFMQQLSASWKRWEARPELRVLLDQNFLCYDGVGEVPSQIHSYLSTQFKELRNLDKDHAQLRHKAKDRWYVPDPKKNIDVETLRNKRLLEEFWLYLPEGFVSAARNPDKAPTLPGMAAATPRPKVPRSKKLREVRTEAIRVGFKHCYQLKDYYTILAVADMLPESVLNEDEQLQMLYDNAALRSGATAG